MLQVAGHNEGANVDTGRHAARIVDGGNGVDRWNVSWRGSVFFPRGQCWSAALTARVEAE